MQFTHFLEKFGVENRPAAVALALRSGLVLPHDVGSGKVRGSRREPRD